MLSWVIGDWDIIINFCYKVGKNLQYDCKDVFDVCDFKYVKFLWLNVSFIFIFVKEDKYFFYFNNYNYYNNYYCNIFQYGGISLEEIICLVVRMSFW